MASEVSDSRVEWLSNKISLIFKTKGEDQINELLRASTTLSAFQQFFQNESQQSIYCFIDKQGSLRVSASTADVNLDFQLAYFSRTKLIPIPPSDFDNMLIWGNMTKDIISHINCVTEDVFLPLFLCPQATAKWPESVLRALRESLNTFLCNIHVFSGYVDGHVHLPIPSESSNSSSDANLSPLHIMESVVITWTKQIRSVLTKSSDDSIIAGADPELSDEVRFWSLRATHLNEIFSQLQGASLRRVLRVLDKNKSTYNSPFAKLCKEVFQARSEANDNCKYLRTVVKWIDRLIEEKNYSSIPSRVAPIIHVMLSIWKQSTYYNTLSRLVIFFIKLSNQVIRLSLESFPSDRVIQCLIDGNYAEAIERITSIVEVIGKFKSVFLSYKSKSNVECPSNPWKVHSSAVFSRMDKYLERCQDLLEMFQTASAYCKLRQIEIGGSNHRILSTSMTQILEEFELSLKPFHFQVDTVFNVAAKTYSDKFFQWRSVVRDLDSRLASIMSQVISKTTNFGGHIRVLEGFEALLVRSVMFDAARSHHVTLIQWLDMDIKQAEEEFDSLQNSPPVPKNCSPIAGAIIWSRGIMSRVKCPMYKLRAIDSRLTEREDFREMSKLYTRLILKLEEYEKFRLDGWFLTVEKATQEKLKLSLLSRKRDVEKDLSYISVNFDEAIIEMMKEIRSFVRLGIAIDDNVSKSFSKVAIFEGYNSSLGYLASLYNVAVASLLPIERPLLRQKLESADRVLSQAHPPVTDVGEVKASKLKWLTWKSSSIEQFIEESLVDVRELSDAVSVAKSNLRQAIFISKSWKNLVTFEKTPKILGIAEFDVVQSRISGQCQQIVKEGGAEILRLLKETNRRLRISQGLPEWKAYVDFVSDIAVDGLVRCVLSNLRTLEASLNPVVIARTCQQPIAEIDIDLIDNTVKYIPDTEIVSNSQISNRKLPTDPGVALKTRSSIKSYVADWMEGIMLVGSVFKRIDGNDGDYNRELIENPEIQVLQTKINDHLVSLKNRSNNLANVFRKYESLWLVDIKEYCESFTRDSVDSSKFNKLLNPAPNLLLYDEVLNKFMNEQREISEIKNIHDLICLRVNGLPMKQSLGTIITKWIFQFTSYLQSYVQVRLLKSNSFFSSMTNGLNKKTDTMDHENLIGLMRCIKAVRDAADDYSGFFSDIGAVVALFGRRAISIELPVIGDRQALDFINCGNVLWTTIVNKAFKMKEDSRALQISAGERIRHQVHEFSRHLHEFLSNIEKLGITDFDLTRSTESYKIIDGTYLRLCIELETSLQLNDLEDLFDISSTSFSELQVTTKKLIAAKRMWNVVDVYLSLIASLRASKWSNVNLKETNFQIEEITRVVEDLPSVSRPWIVRERLFNCCNDFACMVKMFENLKLAEIRDRHWKRFMLASGIDKERTPRLLIGDVMVPNLTSFRAFVEELAVDAVKERDIEKKLDNIDSMWCAVSFGFKTHEQADCRLFDLETNVMEALENDQLIIQSMLSDKSHVEHFKNAVMEWQWKLATVQVVLQLMLDARHLWFSMEGIFMGSRDVKAQLPDDSKRFENADGRFKEFNTAIMENCAIVSYCVGSSVQADWTNLLTDMEQCRKSLADYLDMKRKSFPRFYFLSNSELLELLSYASPKDIDHNVFGSMFNGVTGISFQSSTDTPTPDLKTKRGNNHAICGLQSSEEMFNFSQSFKCQGSIEKWFGDIVDWMQHSMRAMITESFTQTQSWETERPRDVWMAFFPSQVCLVSSRLAWTREIESAFEEIENGSDDALFKLSDLWSDRLSSLVSTAQGSLSVCDRKKISSMIIQDVDFREYFNKFKKSQLRPTSFLWRICFKYYSDIDSGDVMCKISDIRQNFCNEYLGCDAKVALTCLCEKSMIAVMSAHKSFHSIALSGDSGFGKTELMKGVSSLYGLPLFTFSCNNDTKIQFFENLLKGICATGAWACVDSIDSIDQHLLSSLGHYLSTVHRTLTFLSVVSNRETIYQSLPSGTPFSIIGSIDIAGDVPIIPTLSLGLCFRNSDFTELPENMKLSFRQCHMKEPVTTLMLETSLMGKGFSSCREISTKIVSFFERMRNGTNKSKTFEFSLRGMLKIIDMAGAVRMNGSTLAESDIIITCIKSFLLPRLNSDEISSFNRLLHSVFLISCAKVSTISEVFSNASNTNHTLTEKQLNVVNELNEAMEYNAGIALVGNACSGKTLIWKTLANCVEGSGRAPVETAVFDPKSCSQDQAFGSLSEKRVWKDGFVSSAIRRLCNPDPRISKKAKRWIVIDSELSSWCDGFNSCLEKDANIILESCEKICIPANVKLLFETTSLERATPSFVGRVAVILTRETDFDWKNVVHSWILQKVNGSYLMDLFERHIIRVANATSELSKHRAPSFSLITAVSTCCCYIDAMINFLDPNDLNSLEKLFIFSLMWAIGGDFVGTEMITEFSKIWRTLFGSVCKYPDNDTVFDYFPDFSSSAQVHWNDMSSNGMFADVISKRSDASNIFSTSVSQLRALFLSNVLLDSGKSLIIYGPRGSGKSFVSNCILESCEKKHWIGSQCHLSKLFNAGQLQQRIDSSIEKRGAKCYGPTNASKLIVFVEDLHVCGFEDEFDAPLALVRQVCEQACLFEGKDGSTEKHVQGLQFFGTMNPFVTVRKPSVRYLRHLVPLWLNQYSDPDIHQIFSSAFSNHFQSFPVDLQIYFKKYLTATASLLRDIASKFPATQDKNYVVDLRHAKKLFEGLLLANFDAMPTESVLQQYWIHEAARQFEDSMINDVDCSRCTSIIIDTAKKCFDGLEIDDLEVNPPLFLFSYDDSAVKKPALRQLSKPVSESMTANHPRQCDLKFAQTKFQVLLKTYNQQHPSIYLHFHEYFVKKLIAIIRVLSIKGSSAMIIGEHGCGKRSLTKLASFYCKYRTLQLPIELESVISDLRKLVVDFLTGQKAPVVVMLSECHLQQTRLMILLNNFIMDPKLNLIMSADDEEELMNMIRPNSKDLGISSTNASLNKYIILQIRENFHFIVSVRRELSNGLLQDFPSLFSNFQILQFEQPSKSMQTTIACNILQGSEIKSVEQLDSLSYHFVEVHNDLRDQLPVRRSGPIVGMRSFCENLDLFCQILKQSYVKLNEKIAIYSKAADALNKIGNTVQVLNDELKSIYIDVTSKRANSDRILLEMGKIRGEIELQRRLTDQERTKNAALEIDIRKIEEKMETDMSIVRPAQESIQNILTTINLATLAEMRAITKPPPAGVDKVGACMLILFSGEKRDFSWDNVKRMLYQQGPLLARMMSFEARNISDEDLSRLDPLMQDSDCSPDKLAAKSQAAYNLSIWVVNTISYASAYKRIRPLIEQVEPMQSTKKKYDLCLLSSEEKLRVLEARLVEIERGFLKSVEEKSIAESLHSNTERKIGLSQRILGGFMDYTKSWDLDLHRHKMLLLSCAGDCAVTASFLTYGGALNSSDRIDKVENLWIPDLKSRDIMVNDKTGPFNILLAHQIEEFQTTDIGREEYYLENLIILSSTQKWPLVLDSDDIFLKYIQRNEEKKNDHRTAPKIQLISSSNSKWLKKLSDCVSLPLTIALEVDNCDPLTQIDSLIRKSYVSDGKTNAVFLNGHMVDVHPGFRLIIRQKVNGTTFDRCEYSLCCFVDFSLTKNRIKVLIEESIIGNCDQPLYRDHVQLKTMFYERKLALKGFENDLLHKVSQLQEAGLSEDSIVEEIESLKLKSVEVQEAMKSMTQIEEDNESIMQQFNPAVQEFSSFYFDMQAMQRNSILAQRSVHDYTTMICEVARSMVVVEDVGKLIRNVTSALRLSMFQWVEMSLESKHLLLFLFMHSVSLLKLGIIPANDCGYTEEGLTMLSAMNQAGSITSPIDWLSDIKWGVIIKLSQFEPFMSLPKDLKENSSRFYDWQQLPSAESEKLPLEWRDLEKHSFLKLLVVRALRPDRFLSSVQKFVREIIPQSTDILDFEKCSTNKSRLSLAITGLQSHIPILFLEFQNCPIICDVHNYAIASGRTYERDFFSMAVGSVPLNMIIEKIEFCKQQGYWVVVENVHLIGADMLLLKSAIDILYQKGANPSFRLIMTAQENKKGSLSLLSSCCAVIKSESPCTIRQTVISDLQTFCIGQAVRVDAKSRGILFGLCYMHCILSKRQDLLQASYSRNCTLSIGCLQNSVEVVRELMEGGQSTVNLEEIRFMLKNVVYGPHAREHQDFSTISSYVDFFIKDSLLNEMPLFPFHEICSTTTGTSTSFSDLMDHANDIEVGDGSQTNQVSEVIGLTAPSINIADEAVIELLHKRCPEDSMVAFGVPATTDAAIKVQRSQEFIINAMIMMHTKEEKFMGSAREPTNIEVAIRDAVEAVGDETFDIDAISSTVDDIGPYQSFLLRELRMINCLLNTVRLDLKNCSKLMKGEINYDDSVNSIVESIRLDRVPRQWELLSFESLRPLSLWIIDLMKRVSQYHDLTSRLKTFPVSVWIGGFFSPMRFLECVEQHFSDTNSLPLLQVCSSIEPTRKDITEIRNDAILEGVYITGLIMSGAKWNTTAGLLEAQKAGDDVCQQFPVVFCKVSCNTVADDSMYSCPVYKTAARHEGAEFSVKLKTKQPVGKWVLSGVHLQMDSWA